ncbi:hypothetical protein ACU5AX_01515 [Sphingomonas sp. XXL09]|uniref:hypothetical protein n=1 Tax=Sphingomonas sp. XXL09 TaxID=3457787 RepID=UPI00406BC4DF
MIIAALSQGKDAYLRHRAALHQSFSASVTSFKIAKENLVLKPLLASTNKSERDIAIDLKVKSISSHEQFRYHLIQWPNTKVKDEWNVFSQQTIHLIRGLQESLVDQEAIFGRLFSADSQPHTPTASSEG